MGSPLARVCKLAARGNRGTGERRGMQAGFTPVGIEDDDGVRSGEVDAKAASTG